MLAHGDSSYCALETGSVLASRVYKLDEIKPLLHQNKKLRYNYELFSSIQKSFFSIESGDEFYVWTAIKLPSFNRTGLLTLQPTIIWRERRINFGDNSNISDIESDRLTDGFWCLEKCHSKFSLSVSDVVTENFNVMLNFSTSANDVDSKIFLKKFYLYS